MVRNRPLADQQGQASGALCHRIPGARQPACGRGTGAALAGRRPRAGRVRAGEHVGRGQQIRPASRRRAGLPACAARVPGIAGARTDDAGVVLGRGRTGAPVFCPVAQSARSAAAGRACGHIAGRAVDGHVRRFRDCH
ncbi:hypothetical protein G6F35_015546 [Rhizopus arrhizus]|nr:hypothetical protein G6F35_015546 [Rhizopus arrhizus]